MLPQCHCLVWRRCQTWPHCCRRRLAFASVVWLSVCAPIALPGGTLLGWSSSSLKAQLEVGLHGPGSVHAPQP